uniref:Glycoside hydrolase family 31 TIM barrel domain-containing protein n=1 Tax=Mola mola TaxID=94237 RepID=A0A3Q4AYA8_MOLML
MNTNCHYTLSTCITNFKCKRTCISKCLHINHCVSRAGAVFSGHPSIPFFMATESRSDCTRDRLLSQTAGGHLGASYPSVYCGYRMGALTPSTHGQAATPSYLSKDISVLRLEVVQGTLKDPTSRVVNTVNVLPSFRFMWSLSSMNTTVAPLLFADQYPQLSTTLASSLVSGPGSELDYADANVYGPHPFYIVQEEDGMTHGVFLLNSNAMLQPAPDLTWVAIRGVLDLHVFWVLTLKVFETEHAHRTVQLLCFFFFLRLRFGDLPEMYVFILVKHLYLETTSQTDDADLTIRKYLKDAFIKNALSSHCNLHNMYGLTEALATHSALTKVRGKRPFVLSCSPLPWRRTFLRSNSDTPSLPPAVLQFGPFGVPLVGPDICGFGGNTTEELCVQWMQLGAFYPFMRNHSDKPNAPQEPYIFGQRAQAAMRSYVSSPLFHMLFCFPPTHPGAVELTAYLPPGTWYILHNVMSPWSSMLCSSGSAFSTAKGQFQLLPAPLDTIIVHVREGHIVPQQVGPALTTTASCRNPFSLTVALSAGGRAWGDLFWDDGDGLDTFELLGKLLLRYLHRWRGRGDILC